MGWLLVIVFIAAYSARYFYNDTLWWTQLLAILLAELSLAVFVFAPAAFFLASRRLQLAVVLSLFLAIVRFSFVAVGSPATTSGEPLRILTFNNPYSPGQDRVESGRRLMELIESEQPVLMGFQETYVTARPDRFRGHPEMVLINESNQFLVAQNEEGVTRTDQPVFSKLPMREFSATQVDGSERDEEVTEIVRVVATWKEKEFVVYNVHLASYGEEKPWREQRSNIWKLSTWIRYLKQYRSAIMQRAFETHHLLERVQAESLPVIVLGDFNSTPHNHTYGELTRLLDDGFARAARGLGYTYHSRKPFARIDFILIDHRFVALEARVGPGMQSDHRPLMLSIDWRQ